MYNLKFEKIAKQTWHITLSERESVSGLRSILTSWHDYNLCRFAVGIVSSKTICHASWMALTLPLAKPVKACIVQVILDLLDLEIIFFPSQNKCFSKTKSSCGSSAFKREAVLSAQKWEQLNRFKFYCQRYCIIQYMHTSPASAMLI